MLSSVEGEPKYLSENAEAGQEEERKTEVMSVNYAKSLGIKRKLRYAGCFFPLMHSTQMLILAAFPPQHLQHEEIYGQLCALTLYCSLLWSK